MKDVDVVDCRRRVQEAASFAWASLRKQNSSAMTIYDDGF